MPIETEHHAVPRSLGGSDRKANVVRVERDRHSKFHEWAANRPPCQLTRLLALHAIGGETVPPPHFVESIFQITTIRDWTRHYRSEVFRSVSEPGGLRIAAKSADYLLTFCLEELVALRETYAAITNGGSFPAKNSRLLQRSLHFFNTDAVNVAIKRMYTEKNQAGRVTWVGCMCESTRANILNIVGGMEHFKCGPKKLSAFTHIIKKQIRVIAEHERMWKVALKGVLSVRRER